MVSAARSKVRAVFKYALPRREIGIAMKPSRGYLAADPGDLEPAHGIVRLCDDIVGQIGKVEDPATHRVEFRIDQFMHYFHEFPPWGLCVNNIWLEAASASLRVFDTRGWLFHL
jgi:hypothetical protein